MQDYQDCRETMPAKRAIWYLLAYRIGRRTTMIGSSHHGFAV